MKLICDICKVLKQCSRTVRGTRCADCYLVKVEPKKGEERQDAD